LRVIGGPALSGSRLPVLAAATAIGSAPFTAAACRQPLRVHLTRARWLVHRLSRWDRDAAHAIEIDTAGHATPDLFADVPRGDDIGYAARQSDVHVSLDVETTIGPAAPGTVPRPARENQ
jgi:hypothetical protein